MLISVFVINVRHILRVKFFFSRASCDAAAWFVLGAISRFSHRTNMRNDTIQTIEHASECVAYFLII